MLTINMKLITDTKNCHRYEAADDLIVKSALYLKTSAILAMFDKEIPDEIEIVIRRKGGAK